MADTSSSSLVIGDREDPVLAFKITNSDLEERKPIEVKKVKFQLPKKRTGLKEDLKNPLVDEEYPERSEGASSIKSTSSLIIDATLALNKATDVLEGYPQCEGASSIKSTSSLKIGGSDKGTLTIQGNSEKGSKLLLGKRKRENAETDVTVHQVEKGPSFLKVGSLVEVLTKPHCSWAPAKIVSLDNYGTVHVNFFNQKCRSKSFQTSKLNLRNFRPYEPNPHRFIGRPCLKVEVATPAGWMVGRLRNWDSSTGVVKVDFFWRKAEFVCSAALLRSHERPILDELVVTEDTVYERLLRSLHLYTPVMITRVFKHTAEVFPLSPLLKNPHLSIVSKRELRPVRVSSGDIQRVGYQLQEKVEILYKEEIWDGRVIGWDPNTDLVKVVFDWDQRVETFSSYLVRPAR